MDILAALVCKGGPGSGPHPGAGSGKGEKETAAAARASDKALANPTQENHFAAVKAHLAASMKHFSVGNKLVGSRHLDAAKFFKDKM